MTASSKKVAMREKKSDCPGMITDGRTSFVALLREKKGKQSFVSRGKIPVLGSVSRVLLHYLYMAGEFEKSSFLAFFFSSFFRPKPRKFRLFASQSGSLSAVYLFAQIRLSVLSRSLKCAHIGSEQPRSGT